MVGTWLLRVVPDIKHLSVDDQLLLVGRDVHRFSVYTSVGTRRFPHLHPQLDRQGGDSHQRRCSGGARTCRRECAPGTGDADGPALLNDLRARAKRPQALAVGSQPGHHARGRTADAEVLTVPIVARLATAHPGARWPSSACRSRGRDAARAASTGSTPSPLPSTPHATTRMPRAHPAPRQARGSRPADTLELRHAPISCCSSPRRRRA
jgi:hypothetical protein